MDVRVRSNVTVSGPADGPVMLFAHGFGCDQGMWRLVAPELARDHRVVLFDHVGCGGSDLGAYEPGRYSELGAYASDVVDICRELDLRDVVLVAHSVSCMIAALAVAAEPDRFAALVMIGPSARYVDAPGYVGGFSERDIDELLELMDTNHLGWQEPLAGLVGGADQPAVAAEIETAFCRTRPDIARRFARVTFLGDNRADLAAVAVPTLVIATSRDAIAPASATGFVRDAIRGSSSAVIEASGHCPQLSDPDATVAAIRDFLAR